MADEEKKYSWNALKFIQRTPCARESFMYGIVGGLTAGSLYFLKSRHIRRSCDLAVGSFALVAVAGWEACRYVKQKEKEELKKTVELLNQYSHEKSKDEPTRA
ncbi:cytochrome c oxidase assembly protein COX20, mitochondrial [Nematostella vectensis]|uniref:cytochrome c oxidase assembly protein COX20, mitochondrial n=1 Tax=Nematostella vectensis TaxID=45351 RepID=UPI00207749C6|nr:cytochrome c oxidase assembly protein COX20, mitochondrial [Nematostella vectensis]